MSHYVTFGEGPDGVVYPHPDDPHGVEYQLRYGDAESVRTVAASYVAAYRNLIELRQLQRTVVCRRIVDAAKAQQEAPIPYSLQLCGNGTAPYGWLCQRPHGHLGSCIS